jgi:hypothetical protein
MTDPAPQNEAPGKEPAKSESGQAAGLSRLGLLPGLAAISLYLLLLSGVIIVGVASGAAGQQLYPPVFLVFAAVFMAASAGLILLFRWAWALALAAVFLLAVYNLWIFASEHQAPGLVQGLLNLVFFLYLVRTEVRVRLR